MVRYNPRFKVQGTDYIDVSALLPGGVDIHKFSHIYVFDENDNSQRVNVRMDILELGEDILAREKEVLRNIFIEIEDNIRICNPYVKQFILHKIRKCCQK